jgi:arginine N-succinyltransferase
MYNVRPVRLEDLKQIQAMAEKNGARLSTLPQNEEFLESRIRTSIASFAGTEKGKQRFLFVLESAKDGHVAGISGIDAYAGNGAPFYNYRRDELIHASSQLSIHNPVPVLYLSHELTGCTLLCSLMIEPELMASPWLGLLSRARMMFISQFRDLFNQRIIVEIQGVQDEHQGSAFWDSLGRHFFGMDFDEADRLSSTLSRTFIAELMPVHPIYVPLLTMEAQQVLGQPKPEAQINCQLLYREGFTLSNLVDIFDGGPTLVAETNKLNTVKARQCKYVKYGQKTENLMGVQYIVSNLDKQNFKCSLTSLTDGMGNLLRVDPTLAEALAIREGDLIAYSPY